jgi:pimeloyl-ACP methyl ester carboxylesterase
MTLSGERVETAAPTWFREAVTEQPSTSVANVDGVPIHYRRWGSGDGRPVVLVHGGAAHASWWDHIAPLLARHRSVVALDLSGHGDSGRRERYDLELWAAETLAVAEHAGLTRRPVVIGHSLGGFVALRAAMLNGGRLGGVAAIDSPIRDITSQERAARKQRTFRPLRVYLTREEILGRFRPVPADGAPLSYVCDHIAERSIVAVDGGWSWKFDPRIFGRVPLDPASLRATECRIALVRAEHGMLSLPMTSTIVEQLGPRVPVIELAASGHHVMLDQPLALASVLNTLLEAWDQA